jgi:hypothetical protein
MPIAGLGRAIDWSRKRGEAKQLALIRMMAKAEVDLAYLAPYGVSVNSGASTTAKATQPARPALAAFETEDT